MASTLFAESVTTVRSPMELEDAAIVYKDTIPRLMGTLLNGSGLSFTLLSIRATWHCEGANWKETATIVTGGVEAGARKSVSEALVSPGQARSCTNPTIDVLDAKASLLSPASEARVATEDAAVAAEKRRQFDQEQAAAREAGAKAKAARDEQLYLLKEAARQSAAKTQAEEEAKQRRIEATARDAKAKVEADALRREQERLKYLTQFPTVSNGSAAWVFIAVDRKCAQQFTEAMGLEGLEKGKRLEELGRYCGFIVNPYLHARKIETATPYCRIEFVEGSNTGKGGWVQCAWVR